MSAHVDVRAPRPILRNLSRTPSDWSKHVLSMRVTKALSPAPGTFELTLVPAPGQDVDEFTSYRAQSLLYSMFKAQDVVHLGMHWFNPNTNQPENNIFMWGVIDNVFKVKQQMGDSVMRGVHIRGEDVTKLFTKDEAVYAPLMLADPNLVKIFGSRVEFLNYMRGFIGGGDPKNIFLTGDPVTAIWWILRNIPATDVHLEGPNGDPTTIQNSIMVDLKAFANDKVFEPTLTQFSGSVMNYMRAVTDEMFYELWFDTVPDPTANGGKGSAYPILVCRPKPLDFSWDTDSNGNQLKSGNQNAGIIAVGGSGESTPQLQDITLPFWEDVVSPTTGENVTINEEEILSKNLGVSDYEVYTFYNLSASKDPIAGSLFAQFGYYMPILDVTNAKIYGVRAFKGQSKMFSGSYMNKRAAIEAAAKEISEVALDAAGIPAWGVNGIDKVSPAAASMDQFAVTKRDMLWRWNRYNHMFESGPLVIKGRPMSVGGKAILPDETTKGYVDSNGKLQRKKGMEAYITQWTQEYTFGMPWRTQIALTRGHNTEELQAYVKARGLDKAVSLQTNGIESIMNDVLFSQGRGR